MIEEDEIIEEDYNYIVYMLTHSISKKTYIGITNNPERRIRQHNTEIKGGARYTTMNKGNGRWDYYGFILNLSKSMALSIEKKIHIHSRKMKGSSPLNKRLNYINYLLEDYKTIGLEFIIL